MQYAEQPTPPFNSPYQTHAPRSDSLLEPPYLSPNRHESTSKYPQGLGLYNYHHQVPTTLPPSPSPSDSWSGHVSTDASPLMAHAIADPYASGAFEHPIIQSPQPWNGAQLSPRSSVSSVIMVPVYSHSGSDNAYHEMSQGRGAISLEGHGWTHDARYVHNEPTLPLSRHHPLTVAPERLNSTILPYENAYGSTQVAKLESTPAPGYENLAYVRASSERSTRTRTEYPQASVHQASVYRQRRRGRRQTGLSTAAFRCYRCDKGFARQYNYKQHLETHKENREKPHVCPYEDCPKAFVRKTDLNRHNTSVHLRYKDFQCHRCTAKFARKDTRTRHEEDGCSNRGQVSSSETMDAEYRHHAHYASKL
ncbi:hypothetical protein BU25DRAFT_437713 [Macroventuria anomochaeta]|uniref:Uncharacterized protein n=1 Tax=Macroventuria anomochaeta TaxID=301207 RepID=A0ACB6SA70_9PLEO|nr:uncharacterized protein BU25DRAFT_437713 [Macroventuria anomochaeta]KAF2631185.1 hypothetical protein BU25DRAFT_437713 [Macroventuria anomochaeta]